MDFSRLHCLVFAAAINAVSSLALTTPASCPNSCCFQQHLRASSAAIALRCTNASRTKSCASSKLHATRTHLESIDFQRAGGEIQIGVTMLHRRDFDGRSFCEPQPRSFFFKLPGNAAMDRQVLSSGLVPLARRTRYRYANLLSEPAIDLNRNMRCAAPGR